jgi:hypothetical protein
MEENHQPYLAVSTDSSTAGDFANWKFFIFSSLIQACILIDGFTDNISEVVSNG